MSALNRQADETEKLLSQFTEGLFSDEQLSNFSLSQEAQTALYSQAYHLYENGKYQEAKRFFHFLTIVNPYEKSFWIGLGASYQMLKDYARAIEFYSVAAVQDQNNPYVHLHAADCFFALGQMDQAFQALDSAESAANLTEGNQNIISHLALIRQAWSNGKQNEELAHD